MRIRTASDRALLVETADLDEAMRLDRTCDGIPGVIEHVPGARTVLMRFDPLRTTARALAATLRTARPDAGAAVEEREVVIPVRYDGDDLEDVALLLGVSSEEVVRRHLAARWRVAFTGFAPGFGYAVGEDALFDVPRRSSPRTRVPAGAVGLAGAFTGVYPRASPGGWQIIGRTETVMWDVDREPPALLTPGTVVRFERAGRATVEAAAAPVTASASPDPVSPAIEVITASLPLLVQDAGRPGRSALGVSASGAADRTALRDANGAVGNAPDAAVLECAGSATLRFRTSGVAVVTGAVGTLTLTDGLGDAREIPHGMPFATAEGDELHLTYPERGVRAVIGVRGGIAAAAVLGSRSTDVLSGLGPAPLVAGDAVAVGDQVIGAVEPFAVPRVLPGVGDLVHLDITLGPRDDWFTDAARESLTGQEWQVTAQSDRVGIRLHGERALERAVAGELPSEGVVTGAIQVPPDGQPVLFLADHPITGGYPVIAALTDAGLDLAAQTPPGARIRFRIVPAAR